jgi:hypothetical protein
MSILFINSWFFFVKVSRSDLKLSISVKIICRSDGVTGLFIPVDGVFANPWFNDMIGDKGEVARVFSPLFTNGLNGEHGVTVYNFSGVVCSVNFNLFTGEGKRIFLFAALS